MHYQHLLVGLFFTVLVSGCTSINRVALSPQAASNISQVNASLSIPADEIIVRAKPSNISPAFGYGLIPALIDGSISASRQSELEQLSSAFYAKVDHVDFRSTFNDVFKAAIQTQKTFDHLNVSVSTKGLSKTTVAAYKSNLNPEEAFLGVRIWYEFSQDLRSIMVFSDVALSTKNAPDPVYKNSYVYISAPVDSAAPLNSWAENDGDVLSKAFAESAGEIVKMMQQDIAAPENDVVFASMASKEKIKYMLPTFMPMTINGFITEKYELRQYVRADTGILFSIPTK